MQLQDMAKAKVVHEHVWCTMYYPKGHHRNECPTLGSYMATGVPNPFPTRPQTKRCNICKQWGHIPHHFPTLHKYHKTTHTPFCEFCKSMEHDVNNCSSLKLMQEHTPNTFWVQKEQKCGDRGGANRGGFRQGRGRGYGGGGVRPPIYFNCGEVGHVS
jgi:hypothetical protein